MSANTATAPPASAPGPLPQHTPATSRSIDTPLADNTACSSTNPSLPSSSSNNKPTDERSTSTQPASLDGNNHRPIIPSTFITLPNGHQNPFDNDNLNKDDDDDDESSNGSDTDPAASPLATAEALEVKEPHFGPYLASGQVGQRSLSTPNLHADHSLILSPANSPPTSPGLPPIAVITEDSAGGSAGGGSDGVPALSLDGHSTTPKDPSSQIEQQKQSGLAPGKNAGALAPTHSPLASPMASPLASPLTSPMASPSSSPKLSPRNPASASSSPGSIRSLNGSSGTSSARSSPSASPLSTSSSSSSKSKASISSSSSNSGNAVPEQAKTLKSSKHKTINRHSVTSLFDTAASSITLPTNFARKGSLPPDGNGTGKAPGLAGLFGSSQQTPDMTSTPFSLTLAEFRLNDIYPRRQRRLLTVLHRMDNRLRKEGAIKKLTKEQLKGKPDKDVLKPDRKSLNKDYVKKASGGGFMAQRIPAFLRSKKLKKRTRPVILHNIEMAIRDKKPELALQYISLLPSNALKKKKKKAYSDLNRCMLLAMIYRMELVAIEFVDRGFPIDVNYPIIGSSRDEYRTKPGRTGPFEYPSYFIVAVGLGMSNLVKAMIKSANLNQSWCGLTPLLLATTLNECTNATCPPPTLPPAKLASMLSRGEKVHLDISSQTLINQLPSTFNQSTNVQFKLPGYTPTSPNSIVTTLLEYGADPGLGITLQQYLWASKLKGMGVLSRRRKIIDPMVAPGENPIEFYIAARRHESGRQWLSHEEIKARKAIRVQAAAEVAVAAAVGKSTSHQSKKRFSPEMQEYWKGKFILPVEMAIASGNFDCARTILQRLGPNSLATSSFGLLLQNDVMLTLSLLKSGSPVSQHDPHGCTPLHLAARRGHVEMVLVLLQLGGDVNSRGERKWTPLHESISQDHSQISSLLVAYGAEVTIKNEAGETPEETGRRRGLSPEKIAEHLCAAKAKNSQGGLVHHLPSHVSAAAAGAVESRSAASSRRGSLEQLTSNTLKSSLFMTSAMHAHGQLDQVSSRLAQATQTSTASTSSSSSTLSDLYQNTNGSHSHGVNGHGGSKGFHSRNSSSSTAVSANSLNGHSRTGNTKTGTTATTGTGMGSSSSLPLHKLSPLSTSTSMQDMTAKGGNQGSSGGQSHNMSNSSTMTLLSSTSSTSVNSTGSTGSTSTKNNSSVSSSTSEKKKKKVRGFLKSIFAQDK